MYVETAMGGIRRHPPIAEPLKFRLASVALPPFLDEFKEIQDVDATVMNDVPEAPLVAPHREEGKQVGDVDGAVKVQVGIAVDGLVRRLAVLRLVRLVVHLTRSKITAGIG